MKNVTAAEQRRMRNFLVNTLGIKDIEYDSMLSELNARPIFKALLPVEARQAVLGALSGVPFTEFHDRDMQRDCTKWRYNDQGTITIEVHSVHKEMKMPIWVTPTRSL